MRKRNTMQVLRLGTRGSRLALWQAEYVARALSSQLTGVQIEIVTIKTKGDKILDVPLSKIGDKGLFTREIENELLAGKIPRTCLYQPMIIALKRCPKGL